MLAIVAGIMGAFAGNSQSECAPGAQGYAHAGIPVNPPESETGLTYLGVNGTNFLCEDTEPNPRCFWVYTPPQGTQQGYWTPCEGQYQFISDPE